MPDDSIADTIGLILDPSKAQDKIPRNYRSFKLKGHFSRREILFCRPYIVQEACKVVCLVVVRPGGEMRLYERGAFSEDHRFANEHRR
jgi:hypothetical protein